MSRTRWLGAAALAFVVPTGFALARVRSDRSSRDLTSFHGVRLGMSLSDVRTQLDIPGAFHPRPSADGFALEFFGLDRGSVSSATFEFHDGALVAIRADLTGADALAEGPQLEQTRTAVRGRRFVSSHRVLLTLLARTSPANATEVRRLIEGS